ncbi:AAA family ATPase [Halorhabdus sp. CBA1104]|uniref:AAA family ATPase n=1 Tax=unclassified Halorhabdus TaxID=2621901 RepID=UPI0012B19C6D|nr:MULTISPECIES: AAA family ATPase [unclassified Halorhabdus]QGN08092.1 AAA family ATPase [Halorhabdus sp. CBA1104]
MDGPLWTERHAPTIAELPQPAVREQLRGALDEPMNLLVHGPAGAGKTAAVRAFAREAHEDHDADLIEINVADFFDLTKSELSDDPRFERFITPKRRRESSKADLINHVLKESASYAPVSGSYKTILLDNAERMRADFQQALRRVMEQYYEATQFVIATRQSSTLIPPIRSRCFPVTVREPTHDEIETVLGRIAEREGATYDDEGLEYVAGYADGDLRQAILGAQTTYENEGEITMAAAYEALGDVQTDDRVERMLTAAEEGQFRDARSELDELLIDEGHSGVEVLAAILRVGRSRYTGQRLARLHTLAGDVDLALGTGTDDRIHLSRLLAEFATTA